MDQNMIAAIGDAIRGKDRTIIRNKIHVDILTEATMRAVSGCTIDANLSQTIQINCTENAGDSRGCNACLDMIATTKTARDVIGLESGAGFDENWPNSDACEIACRSCIVRDVTQSQVVQLKSTCDVFADFDVKIKNKMSEAVEEVLAKQEDVTGAIGKIFGGPTKTEAINEYSGALKNVVTREFSNQLKTQILALQTIKIGKKSVIVQHVDQTINAAMVSSLISKTSVQDRVFNQAQVDAAMSILKKDTTIADLIDGLTAATIAPLDFLSSTMGMIIMIATVALIIGVVLLFILGVVRPGIYGKLGDAADAAIDRKLKTSGLNRVKINFIGTTQ
jgi:hypothetical protein